MLFRSTILGQLGFLVKAGGDGQAEPWTVTPPSWRRDVEGKADLVEEVARIVGFDHLPNTPLPDQNPSSKGVLNPRQARIRLARRALAAPEAQAAAWPQRSRRPAASRVAKRR